MGVIFSASSPLQPKSMLKITGFASGELLRVLEAGWNPLESRTAGSLPQLSST
jgi:hypothetical protein